MPSLVAPEPMAAAHKASALNDSGQADAMLVGFTGVQLLLVTAGLLRAVAAVSVCDARCSDPSTTMHAAGPTLTADRPTV